MTTATTNQSDQTPNVKPASTHGLHIIDGLGHACQQPISPPAVSLDPRTFDRALNCVHCGLCLPACPTYTQNGMEADSPRGRIYLMKGLATGEIDLTDNVQKHLDLCLDCHACETACPSGVVYHELIEGTREHLAKSKRLGIVDYFVQLLFKEVFTKPTRLKCFMLPAKLLQKIGLWKILTSQSIKKLLPAQIEKMTQMLPEDGPLWEKPLKSYYPATANKNEQGTSRATVSFFAGCVGSVMFQEVNRKAIAILQHIGCDVIVSQKQKCCGAIHHHAGDSETARKLAKQNIDTVITKDGKALADYVVNTIAGCGASLKQFDHLLRDDDLYATRAEQYVKINRDISELIVALNPPRPTHRVEKIATLHHACHLHHAQKITTAPQEILSWIEGLTVKPLVEADMCCGAAGTYNLTQPQMAKDLAARKIGHIQKTHAEVCATANVGCAMQIESEGKRLNANFKTTHPIDLLYEAYFGS